MNTDFEQVDKQGKLIGWTILSGLDPHRYGPPDLKHRFDAIVPAQADDGYHSSHCLGFPAEGTWFCPVFNHKNANDQGVNGKELGKAAAYQTVELPVGRYRFSAWLRTAAGGHYSATFRLGMNPGQPADYANDDSTGIRWSRSGLGVRRADLGGVEIRGEWGRYETEVFEVDESGPVTVWIRFDYANENQFETRWQVDDVAITAAGDEPSTTKTHTPCATMKPTRLQSYPGDDETYFVDAGDTKIVEATEKRAFRHARELQPGQSMRLRFPWPSGDDEASLLVCWSGPMGLTAGSLKAQMDAGEPKKPTTGEWLVKRSGDHLDVELRAVGSEPMRVYEVELGSSSRTAIRLANVEADVVDVPWVVGVWDATGREFTGEPWQIADRPDLVTNDLTANNTWRIRFDHKPHPSHRTWFIHGLIRGRCTIDVGDDGIIDWIAEQQGEEIVDLDVTDLLTAGENVIVVETTGRHDFAAMVETCPGATDLRSLPIAFGGDELAEGLTRVVDNTWFWLRELHHEPTGFLDASIPHGKWFNQFWPIDIAFALREWVRYGHQEEAEHIALLTASHGWQGHESNRSGGWDNTAGNMIVQLFAEILRRSDHDPALVDELWPVLEVHAKETLAAAEASPFDGLIRGTNWENAGNHGNGPCYALSTTLGAADSLRVIAETAERLGKDAPTAEWRACADRLRKAVIDRLVFKEDHNSPTGYVYPAGTWAYGLKPDGSVEDQPLCAYFWAGAGITDVDGLFSNDRELLDIYGRTLEAAAPLYERGHKGAVSGYSTSYDGPEVSLVTAAVSDRIDLFEPLLRAMAEATDFKHDKGALLGELSRWAQGGPEWEDTNLVCAGSFLWPFRIMAGVDDLLTDDRQLRLVPRLPWSWKSAVVNDWSVRCRDESGKEVWAKLSYQLQRDAKHVRMTLTTDRAIVAVPIRLGPFPKDATYAIVTIDSQPATVPCELSGDATWAWTTCDLGKKPVTVDVRLAD